MIDITQVGAAFRTDADGSRHLHIGIDLPGITYDKGYAVEVRIIHAADQLLRGIDPQPFLLFWHNGSDHDLWDIDIDLAAPLPDPASAGHFGQPGQHLYRFVVLRGMEPVGPWVADPFGTTAGLGGLSAVQVDPPAAFTWTDQGFRVPEVDRMVVYELHVAEFNVDFDGVTDQLDYLAGLGVNVIELMPLTQVKEVAEWGYTPLGFFAPDARFGDADGLRRLVNAAHGRGIAVIHDAVYAHAHPEFAYNLLYLATGEPNPMMGVFAGEFFSQPGTDYTKQFTRDYFLAVNQYWLAEFHIDGFRYDYVPGYWDGPTGVGYAALVHATYEASSTTPRFKPADGTSRSLIVQCAENLPDPIGTLSTTYSNCAWQNSFMDLAAAVAAGTAALDTFAHQLDPQFIGYPASYTNPATGETIPVAPFQYIETHDQSRFIDRLAGARLFDLLGQPLGDRSQFYRLQPYAIALLTAKGIPMLWQGQEFAEDWSLPNTGIGRNLFPRPLHWEYFYDDYGKALVRLYRVLGSLRARLRALSSRNAFFYYDDPAHRAQGVIAYRRQADAVGAAPAEDVLVMVNVFQQPASVWLQFPSAGTWIEQIDIAEPGARPAIVVATAMDWHEVQVPSNYGAIYLRT